MAQPPMAPQQMQQGPGGQQVPGDWGAVPQAQQMQQQLPPQMQGQMQGMPMQHMHQMPMQAMQPIQQGPMAPGGAGAPQMQGGPPYGYSPMPGAQGPGQGQAPGHADGGMGGSPSQLPPQQQGYMGYGSPGIMQGLAPDGSGAGMVGMPYSMDSQMQHPAMMMVPGGPGGYMMMPQQGGHMQQGMMMLGPGGVPGNYMIMPQGCQGMHGMPQQLHGGHLPQQPGQGPAPGQDAHSAQQLMMMSMPAGGSMGQSLGQGMGQVGMLGQPGMGDPDGKGGSRVAAPVPQRHAQPKQGAGGWHPDRRSARPPATSAAGGLGDMGSPGFPSPTGAPGGSSTNPSTGPEGQSPSTGKLGPRIANPKNPWADMQDPGHGGVDPELRQMWDLRPNQQGRMSPPPTPQGSKHGMQSASSQGQAGRTKGGGPSAVQHPASQAQQAQQAQRWMPVEIAPSKGQGKGQQAQNWAPKAAPAPMAPTPAPLSAAPSTKGAGKKTKSKRDHEMDDWLSQRFQGQPPPSPRGVESTSTGAAPHDTWNDYSKGGGGFDEEPRDYEDAGGRRAGKKRGGKGAPGAPPEAVRPADKGKGGGKGKGGKWRPRA